MLRFLKILNAKRIPLVIGVAVAVLLVQPSHRPGGQELPVVRLISVEPSSQVLEGNSLHVTLGISPPVSAGDPGLTGGRLRGGIRVWDSEKGTLVDQLIAFAFYPGENTKTLGYSVDVADDGGAVNTNRTIRIDINPLFREYSVGSPSGATVRVLDRDSTSPPPPQPPPPPPEDTPTPVPTPEDTPTPVPPPPSEDTPTPVPPPPPEDTPTPVPPPPPEDTPTPVPPPPPEDTPTPVPPPPPPPEDTPTPVPPPPTPTLVPPPTNTPEPTPTHTPTAEPTLSAPLTPPDTGSGQELVQPGLDQPSAPVMSRAIPRVREALGGIASTPRRRVTLIIIQGLASVFATAVFARLILRRE